MQNAQHSLFTRPDTVFGVCEGLGQDFGINSQLLRLGFGAMLFWSPTAALITYAALGVAVLVSRLLFPTPSASDGTATAQPAAAPAALVGENDAQPAELAVAA